MGHTYIQIGQQFDDLTVIEKTEKRDSGGSVIWRCQCKCGEIVERSTTILNRKKQWHSCLKCKKVEILDLTNKKIGRLTVIDKTDKRASDGTIIWKCICDCGAIVERSTANLTRKNREQSCGCKKIDFMTELGKQKSADLLNKRFGKLLVIEKLGQVKEYQQVYWRCLCDCGNEWIGSSAQLLRGINHCGCEKRSNGEKIIEKILQENSINFQTEYIFEDLVGYFGKPLRYDFAILDSNNKPVKLIEYDGIQHFEPVEAFGGIKEFQKRREYDELKNEYAINKGIPLLRIPYSFDLSKITLKTLL